MSGWLDNSSAEFIASERVYLVHGGGRRTRLLLGTQRILRHLSLAGFPKVEAFEVRSRCYDCSGRLVSDEVWESPAGEELVFDSAERLPPGDGPLEGSVLLDFPRIRLAAPAPAGLKPPQRNFNGILLLSKPGSFITGTHVYHGVETFPLGTLVRYYARKALRRAAHLLRGGRWSADALGASVVHGGGGGRGFAVMHSDNPAPPAISFIETRDGDGRPQRRPLPALSAGQTLCVELPSSGWSQLLCALPPAGVSRFLTGERFDDGRFCLDHNYFQQPAGSADSKASSEVRWFDRSELRDGVIGPSHPWPCLHGPRVQSWISLCSQFHPEQERVYDLRVFDNAGRLVLERPEFARLPPYGLRVLSVSAELDKEGLREFEGTYLLSHSARAPQDKLPSRIHAQGLYRFPDGYWNGVQSDASIWSSPDPKVPAIEALSLAKVRRKQVWYAPVIDDDDVETLLAVSNLSYSLGYRERQTLGVRYCEGDQVLGEAEIELPPFGARLVEARQLFGTAMPPRATGARRSGAAVFYPKTGLTYCASVMYRDRRSGVFVLEHVLPLPKYPHENQ